MRLSQRNKRPAFTLIELIVVITILTVVAALTIGAIGKSFNWIKQKNTEQTMTKVILRLQRVIDRLYKEADDWPASTEPFILEQAAGSYERARILKVLYLYKWNFPNSYAEAFHNVQESRQLYDNRQLNVPPASNDDPENYPGYPPARAILNKLRQNNPAIPNPFAVGMPYLPRPNTFVPAGGEIYTNWPGGTPAAAAMATVLPRQSAACMMASFTYANGSPDEFSNNEVVVDSSTGDANPFLADAWGTPLLFLRHGNFIYSRHRVGSGTADRCAWTVGMVKPAGIADLDFAPLEFALNPAANQPPLANGITSFYFQRLQERSQTAYPSLGAFFPAIGKDPFDPTGMLKSNQQWRTNNVSNATFDSWLNPNKTPWLAIPGPGNPPQHVSLFRRTFGYMPEELRPLAVPNQAYCPMVIISAGGDKVFNAWDDNLDSYRLQVNVSGQQ